MEDQKMQMKAEATQLCKMLSKPDSQRMPFEGVEIAKSLQRTNLLSKLFDMKSESFINLCITSNIHEFDPNTSIYDTEINSRYIYIILEGKVKISLKNQTSDANRFHILRQFGMFGQTEILFNLNQRQQKIETQNLTVKCMVLEQQKVKSIVNQSMLDFMSKAYHYFAVNQYFQILSIFEKQQLVLYMSLQNFTKNDTVVHNSSLLTAVLYFVHGNISVVKQFEIPKKSTKCQKYRIDTLGQMDSYGQYECVNGEVSSFMLIANTSGVYYALDYENLKKNSNHKILEIIKQKAVPYPDEQELGFLYDIKNTLQSEVNRIVKKNRLF